MFLISNKLSISNGVTGSFDLLSEDELIDFASVDRISLSCTQTERQASASMQAAMLDSL